MNGSKTFGQSTQKSIVFDKSKWDSIRGHVTHARIAKSILDKEQQYRNYLYEESRAMTSKWKNSLEADIENTEQERLKVERIKMDEAEERFKKLKEDEKMQFIEQSFDKMQSLRMNPAVGISGQRNLTRIKLDEYKTELREFIENKKRRQLELNRAQCEQQRLERHKIESELVAQSNKERILLANRKAANRNIELEAMQISEIRKLT